MNRAELSKLLEQKVQEKLQEGYSINTYAMDVASADRVKRSLKPQANQCSHENHADQEWQDFISQVEAGTYLPENPKQIVHSAASGDLKNEPNPGGSSSVGLWRIRRH